MSETRLLEKSDCLMTNAEIKLLLKHQKHEELKIYFKKLIQHIPIDKAVDVVMKILDEVEEKDTIVNCIDIADKKLLIFAAMQQKNQRIISLFINESFIENISGIRFCKLLIYLLQNNMMNKAREIIAWGNSDFVLAYLFKKNIFLNIESLHLLCENGANPLSKHFECFTLEYALQMDHNLAVEYFLNDTFLQKYTDEELGMIFVMLIKEGWLLIANNLLKIKKQAILAGMNKKELDSIFFAIVIEYGFEQIPQALEIQDFLRLLLDNGANPFRHFYFENEKTNAFILMPQSWNWLLSQPFLKYYHDKDLMDALMLCAYSNHEERNYFIKNIMIYKKDICKKNLNKNNLHDILFKLVNDRVIDNAMLELLLELGGNPFVLHGSKCVVDILLHIKDEYKIELILDNNISNISTKYLSLIYSTALKNNWTSIKEKITSDKNSKKIAMIDKLNQHDATVFIVDCMQDEKPNDDFIRSVITHRNVKIALNEAVLNYALHKKELIKAILTGRHCYYLTFAQAYHALQILLTEENSAERMSYFSLFTCLNYIDENHDIKQKALNTIFLHEIHKVQSISEVMKIVKFIQANKNAYIFIKHSFLSSNWKMLKKNSVEKIIKIASTASHIEFASMEEHEEVKKFLQAESKLNLMHNKKKEYEQLTKHKIVISSSLKMGGILP